MMTVVIAIAAAMAIFRDICDKLVNLLNEEELFIKYITSNHGYY